MSAFRTAWLVLLISGCAPLLPVRDPYPSGFPTVEEASVDHGCPRLAGSYVDAAAAVNPEAGQAAPRLSGLLSTLGAKGVVRGQAWAPVPESAAVTVTESPDRLTLAFTGDTPAQSTTLDFRRQYGTPRFQSVADGYVCGESAVTFLRELALDHSSGLLCLTRFSMLGESLCSESETRTTLSLLRTTDGSLVARTRTTKRHTGPFETDGSSLDTVWIRFASAGETPRDEAR